MKLFVLCLFGVMALALAGPPSLLPPEDGRGCIYINGRCSSHCPVGTHAYTTGCGFLKPEPSCDEPHPVQDTRGMICDYSSCYCDESTVRDTVSKKCMKLEDCPKKHEEHEHKETPNIETH